jgi:hypothetical protein
MGEADQRNSIVPSRKIDYTYRWNGTGDLLASGMKNSTCTPESSANATLGNCMYIDATKTFPKVT